jgi:peptidyl-prolyl cis-trans isomerase D
MIEALRSHASGWIAKILIGLLAISFAVWGIGDMFRPPQNNVLATVGDQEITSEGFERAFDREVRAFGERAGTNITAEQARAIGIDREVLNQLLSGAALDNQAARLDLRLADAYVARLLAENPAFHDASGQFSPERFRQVLRASGLGEQEVIRSERDAMISNSIIDAVAADPAVPSTLTEIAWLHRNEQRDARWFTLPAATVTVPEPTDAELKAYFDANQAKFTTPERRSATLIEVTPATVAAAIDVPEADVRAEYDRRRETLGQPEKRRILQIPFPDASQAQAARDRIASGTPFEDVARERGLKDSDMLLGDLAKAQVIDSAVAEAAFALPLNEVSQPVTGRLSTFLIKVAAITPGQTPTFGEARAALAGEIAMEQAREQIIDLHGRIEDARAAGKTFEELAQAFGLPLRAVGPMSRDGRDAQGLDVKDLPERETLIAAVFGSDTGVENDPVSTADDGFVWFDVREVSPAALRPFDEAKGEAIEGWKARQRRDGVLAAARALVKRLEQGARLDDLAKEAGLEVKQAQGLKRTESSESFDASAVQALFAAPPAGFAAALEPDGSGAKVIQSTPVMQPPFNAGSEDARAIERVLAQRLTGDLSTLYLQGLQQEYGVKLNEDLWRKLAGER